MVEQAWVLGNFPVANWQTDASTNVNLEYGTNFQVAADATCTHLRWYRSTTNANQKPTHLRLWQRSTQTVLAEATSIPDDGTVGWQEYAITAQPTLAAGEVYTVSFAWETNRQEPFFPLGVLLAPDFPAQLSFPIRSITNSGSIGFPNNNTGAFIHGVDARVEAPATIPIIRGDVSQVDALLYQWFSENDNVHQTELPYRTWQQAVGANSNAQNSWLSAQAAQTAAEGNASAITNVSTQVESVGGNVSILLNRLSADLAQKLNDVSDGLAGLLNDAASVLGGGWNTFVNQMTRATGGSGFGGPDPLQGWTQVDEIEFTNELAWPVAADLYRVSLDNVGSKPEADPVAGVHVAYRLGWWSPLDGGFFRERRYLDGPNADLVGTNGRMPGLVLFLNNGGHGFVAAWTKDPVA